MRCTVCALSLLDINKRVYICEHKKCSPSPQEGNATYWCKTCKETTEHDHPRTKVKGAAGTPFPIANVDKDKMTDEQKQQYLDNLFEEYHNLDYEDVIAGGMLTRFRYTQVEKEDYGLSNEEILLLDDKQLNSIISIKKYRPYNQKEQEQDPEQSKKIELYKVIQRKQQFKQEIQDGLKLVKEVQQAELEEEKAKHLKRQLKKQKKEKHLKKRKHEEVEEPEEVDSKRKRMALYD